MHALSRMACMMHGGPFLNSITIVTCQCMQARPCVNGINFASPIGATTTRAILLNRFLRIFSLMTSLSSTSSASSIEQSGGASLPATPEEYVQALGAELVKLDGRVMVRFCGVAEGSGMRVPYDLVPGNGVLAKAGKWRNMSPE